MERNISASVSLSVLPDATTDDLLVSMWLHGRPASTRSAYQADATRFLRFVDKPLQTVTLADFQAFCDSLSHLKPASQARPIRAIKSLLTFAYETGYTAVNIGKIVKPPKIANELAARIVSEEEIMQMIILERDFRNRVMLRLLFATGIRVSELCDLTWRDVQAREDAGQITIAMGKGGKTRAIRLKKKMWQSLSFLREEKPITAHVFRSRGGGRKKGGGKLDTSQVWRIVRNAAKRAGIEAEVSPHWLRHAHATYALQRGASISLVQATLGHESMQTTARYLHANPEQSSGDFLPEIG
jgi:integrase/recombinase XerD